MARKFTREQIELAMRKAGFNETEVDRATDVPSMALSLGADREEIINILDYVMKGQDPFYRIGRGNRVLSVLKLAPQM